jgi:glutathionylspermidine synthase
MVFLAGALEAAGLETLLVAPDHIVWRDDRPAIEGDSCTGRIDYLVRFFPLEWMPNLDRRTSWQHFVASAAPASNPGRAMLCQTKRLPLVWGAMDNPMSTWKSALPETRCPKTVAWSDDTGWILKPAFGRVGEGVGLRDHLGVKEWTAIARRARRNPEHWVAQRRFDAVPMCNGLYPCLGVYTIDGEATGIYGRAARRPLIDHRAIDVAVLLDAGQTLQ